MNEQGKLEHTYTYTCGSVLFSPESPLHNTIVVRLNFCCADPVEAANFFSRGPHTKQKKMVQKAPHSRAGCIVEPYNASRHPNSHTQYVTGFGKTLPPYGIRMRFAQCVFLVAQIKICQSPDFVIYMSNNPSSNCYRLLRRLVVLYEGEISLYFDPPSRHSHRTRSPLLWAVIRILYLDTARFIELLYVSSPF